MLQFHYNTLFKFTLSFAVIFFLLNIKLLTGIETANAIEKFFFLLAGIFLILRNRNNDILIILIPILLLTLVSAAFSNNQDFSWLIYFKALTQIFIIYFLLSGKLHENDKTFILKFFAWLPLIMIALGLVYSLMNIQDLFYKEYASGLPRLQLTIMPSFIGGLAIATTYAALKCADKFGYQYFWLFGLSTLMLLLTSARIPLLITTVLCSLVFFTSFNGKKNLKWLVFFSFLLFFALIMIVAGDLILGRLTQVHMSGRDIIWEHLYSISSIYPNFGVGFGHQIYFMPHEVTVLTGGTMGAHSEIVRLQVELGYIPSKLFFLLFILTIALLAINKNYDNPKEILLSAALFLLFCVFDNAFASPSLFLFLIVVVLANSAGKTTRHKRLNNRE